MKKKEKKQEFKVGECVCTASSIFINRLQRTNSLRSEAEAILGRCSDADRDTWKDIYKEYGIPEDYIYQINNVSGDVTVIGKKHPK